MTKISNEFYQGELTIFEDVVSKLKKKNCQKFTQIFQVSTHLHPCHPQQ